MSNRQRIHHKILHKIPQLSQLSPSLKERHKTLQLLSWKRAGSVLLAAIAASAVTSLSLNSSTIAADRLAGNKQSQPVPSSPAPSSPAPSSPAPSSPAPDAIDATVLAFETSQYTVRIFRQSGDLRMNLYNRQADKVEQNNLPMLVHVVDTGITFTNRGDRSTVYSIRVAPDGSNYRLTIQQGDRVTYSQQVAHAPAAPSPAASPEPSLAPNPDAQIPPAPPLAPPPAPPAASPSTSSRDLAPRNLAPDPSTAPANATIPDSATIALFQTAKYAVRVYDDSGELRMNIYNRRTDKVELKAVPVQATRSGQTTTAYTNLAGNPAGNPTSSLIYTAIVEPVGGYRLQVRQGDRIIYSELGY